MGSFCNRRIARQLEEGVGAVSFDPRARHIADAAATNQQSRFESVERPVVRNQAPRRITILRTTWRTRNVDAVLVNEQRHCWVRISATGVERGWSQGRVIAELRLAV